MSRLFDDALSQCLLNSSTPIIQAPFTVACFYNSNDLTNTQYLMSICDSAGDQNYWRLQLTSAGSGNKIAMFAKNNGTESYAMTTTGSTVNTWHHACGVEAASNDRRAYIDGGSKDTDNGNVTPAGIDRIGIGVLARYGLIGFMSGMIAEAAIWNVALNDYEVQLLANGECPLRIRPNNLVAYCPLIDNDRDHKGKYDMLEARNGPRFDKHPLVFYPKRFPTPSLFERTRLFSPPSAIKELSGIISAQSSVSGALKRTRKISGVIAAQSSLSATAKLTRKISGTITALSNVTGALRLNYKLAGTIAAQSSLTGTLYEPTIPLAGLIAAQSFLSGRLSVNRWSERARGDGQWSEKTKPSGPWNERQKPGGTWTES
jgi:hypothetical protein